MSLLNKTIRRDIIMEKYIQLLTTIERNFDRYLDVVNETCPILLESGEGILSDINHVRRAMIEEGGGDSLMRDRNYKGSWGDEKQEPQVSLTDIMNGQVSSDYDDGWHDDGGQTEDFWFVDNQPTNYEGAKYGEYVVELARSVGYNDATIDYYLQLVGPKGFEELINQKM